MEQKFLEFVADIFGVNVSEISLDTKYGEIPAWDSLMQLRLVGEIDDEFGVDIPIDEVPNIKTLRDYYKYIEG